MDLINKKARLFKIAILLLALVLLSLAVNARPITDLFKGVLIEITDILLGKKYQPYMAAIDFFVFSIFFVAVYIRVAKGIFKEIQRPERVIVILLGIVTGFLFVVAGFSIIMIGPYVHWVVYGLIFKGWWYLLGLIGRGGAA